MLSLTRLRHGSGGRLSLGIVVSALVTGALWATGVGAGAIGLGSSTTASNSGGNSLTLNAPAVSQDDLLIAQVTATTDVATTVICPPTGWSSSAGLTIKDTQNKVLQQIFYRVAPAAEAVTPYTWQFRSSSCAGSLVNQGASGGITRYTGVDTASPIDVAAGTGGTSSSTTATAPAVTTSAPNARVIRYIGAFKDTSITPSSSPPRVYLVQSASGTERAAAAFDAAQASAGSTGTFAATLSSSGEWVAQTVALKEAAPPASATFTVSKDFSDDSGSTVSVSLSCASGTVAASPLNASEGSPAVFTVTGGAGDPACDASEGSAPAGYTADESDCQDVALVSDGACTIANTLNSATFTVSKDFSDDSGSTVSVSLSCASGTVAASPLNASEGSPAVFTVTGGAGDPACDASEGSAPAGYTADESDCQDVALVSDGACTIANTLDPVPPPPAPPPSGPLPTPTSSADLSVVLSASPASVAVGSEVTFTIVVANDGPDAAIGASVAAGLSAGLDPLSISASQGSCAQTTCAIGSPDESESVTVTLVARAVQAGRLASTASAFSTVVDPFPANGTSSVAVDVLPGAPLPSPSPPGSAGAASPAAPIEDGELFVAPLHGGGQCVALVRQSCRPVPQGGRRYRIREIAYVDPGRGTVRLTGKDGTGTFRGTRFDVERFTIRTKLRALSVSQRRPALLLRMLGGELGTCAAGHGPSLKRTPIRVLWSNVKGRFRVRGRRSAATVRAGAWLTRDFCEGTLTRVVNGRARVRRLGTGRWFTVRFGERRFVAARLASHARRHASP